ncbi:MAG: hypothetical protein V1718_05080 [archaeon]
MAAKKPTKKTRSSIQKKAMIKKQETVKKEDIAGNPKDKSDKNSSDLFDTSGTTFWKAATVVFALLFLFSIFTHGFSFDGNKTATKTSPDKPSASTGDKVNTANIAGGKPAENAVKLDFYVMSQCPYGTQVEDAIKPVLDKLGNNIDFSLNFIASDNGDGTFKSLHGQPEVEGNIVQLCAAKYNSDKYMDMIICQNKNAGAIPGNWEQCAADNSLDTEKIKACFEGEEGKELFRASIKASEAVSARGSPTIYLDDNPYAGGRTENDFLRAVCNSFEGTRPDACSAIPEPIKVNAIVISDKRCGSDCDTSRLVGQLKSLFPGLTTKDLDYSDKEAKDLMEKSEIKYLPAFLFEDSVQDADGYSNIKNYLKKAGDYQTLQIGASFDPTAEICGNDVDDDSNGKADCEDDACKSEWTCMGKLEKPKVELFVMSHCPYGTQAEKGILPVLDVLSNKIDFSVKFVYYAMHGETELNEQTLQYCIQKNYNDKYTAYLKCFLKEGNSDACVTEVGLDKAALDTCIAETDTEFRITEKFNDKSTWSGGSYPPFDIYKTENEKYGVGGSPTLVINGVVAQTGRDPASLLGAVCTGFTNKPTECSVALSGETPSPGFGFETTASAAQSAGAGCGV